MTVLFKRAVGIVIVLGALAAAFFAGRWSESLQSGLQQEANYPWDLHRKMGQVAIDCDVLAAHPSSGRFHVYPLDDGGTLIVASHDRQTGKVTGFALDSLGRVASDNWIADCPR